MKVFAQHSPLAAVWIAGALLLAACESQNEGERCDIMNGTADCASGLICGDSKICCVAGSPACNAPPTGSAGGSGAAGASGSDAAPDGSSTASETGTSEATTSDAATNEATTSEATTSEAATMSETGAESGPAKPDAADGATE